MPETSEKKSYPLRHTKDHEDTRSGIALPHRQDCGPATRPALPGASYHDLCRLDTVSTSGLSRGFIHIDAWDFFRKRLASNAGNSQNRTGSSPEVAFRAGRSHPVNPVHPVHRCSILLFPTGHERPLFHPRMIRTAGAGARLTTTETVRFGARAALTAWESSFFPRNRSGSMDLPRLAPVTVICEVTPVFRERTFLGDWSPWISAYSR